MQTVSNPRQSRFRNQLPRAGGCLPAGFRIIVSMETTPIWLRLGLTLGLMTALLVLSIIPGRAEEGDSVLVWAVAMTPTSVQKLAHLLLYGLLAFLWAWTLSAIESVVTRLMLALALAAGFGIPGRFGTAWDMVLNAAGAAIGLIAALFLL